eukprot:scaffold28606_cov161-Amphora_coffeaeformis.AAC.3
MGQSPLFDVGHVFVIPEFRVFNGLPVHLGEFGRHLGILDGSRRREVVHLVAMRFLIEQYDDGRVGHVVRTHVIDTHTVTGRHEIVFLAQMIALVEQGTRHEMRGGQNGVRDARILFGEFEQVIAGSVKLDKGYVLSVLIGNLGHALEVVCGSQKGYFDKVFDLVFLTGRQKGWKDVGPTVNVGQRTKDSLNVLQGLVVFVGILPIKVDDFGATCNQEFGALVTKGIAVCTRIQTGTIALPNAHAYIPVSGFQEGHGHTVTNHTGTGRDAVCT